MQLSPDRMTDAAGRRGRADRAGGPGDRFARRFGHVREASGRAILVVLGLQVASSTFVNAVVFRGEVGDAIRAVHRATGGLVTPNLLANLVPLAVVVGIGVFRVARLRPRDTGLIGSQIAPAAAGTLALWVAVQGALVAAHLLTGDPVRLHSGWRDPGAGFVLGGVAGQLFGNALAEEIIFRGFLFPQLLLKLRRRLDAPGAVLAAALASQVIFALLHIPNRLFIKGFDLGPALLADQMGLVFGGLLFLGLWLATRNLLFVVGAHALANRPVPLIEASPSAISFSSLVLVTALLVAVPLLRRRWRTHRGRQPGR